MAGLVPFGEWLPDQPEFQNPGAITMTNVLPRTVGSYGPAPQLSAVTVALSARCQGATYARAADGTIAGFAGDATKLYLHDASNEWSDVTRLDAALTITNITQANPAVVTYTGTDPSNGDRVYIAAVVGMTQVNGLRFTIANVNAGANTFELQGINSTAYTAYVSGGTAQKVLHYSTASDERWAFTVFGSRILTTNYADAIQSYVLGSSNAFADLAAAAPKARYIARVRDFIMVANTTDPTYGAQPQRVWWPAIDDPTNWPTPGTAGAAAVQSDFQDLVGEGGWNQGLVGGLSGADVAIFQERCIWRGQYIGPSAIFSFQVVESARGTPAPGSIVSVGPVVYYLADDGFYVFDGASSLPIGDSKVDKTFWTDVDTAYLFRITAAADPLNKIIYWAYPGPQNSGGTPNRIIAYHYGVQRWSRIEQMTECLIQALTIGYDLEDLDAFGTLETLPFSLDSRAWTGGRLNLAAFDTDHKLALFSGAPLAATMDTAEAQLNPMGSAHVSRAWPVIDTASATMSVGKRDRLSDSVVFGSASSMTSTTGSCPLRSTGRYQRARVQIPAGVSWSKAQGVQFEARAAGRR